MQKFWRIARSSTLVKKYIDDAYKNIEGKDISALRLIDIHRRMLVRVQQVQSAEINKNKKNIQQLIKLKIVSNADAAADAAAADAAKTEAMIQMRLHFISELKNMNKEIIEPIVVQIHSGIMLLEKQRWLQQQQQMIHEQEQLFIQQTQEQSTQTQEEHSCDCIPGESGCDSCCNCNTVGLCVGCAHHGEHRQCNCCSK